MDPKSFFRVNVLGHELFFHIHLFYFVIKNCFPSIYICYNIYYNRHQVLTAFMNMIHIFGVITVYFPSNDSYIRKKHFPNSAFFRYFSLSAVRQSLKSFLYLFTVILSIQLQKKMSAPPAKSNTLFLLSFFSIIFPKTFQMWTW